MSIQELTRPERRGAIQIPPEQEAKIGLVQLTRRFLNLGVDRSFKTPYVKVKYNQDPDARMTEEDIRTQPYEPITRTQVINRGNTVHISLIESPTNIYLCVVGLAHPAPDDYVAVEYEKKGVNQGFLMVGGPQTIDGKPASAETTLMLTSEGQTLLDLVKQS